MIIQKTKKAIVLIYVLFLVTISIVFASIVLSNTDSLFNISKHFEIDYLLYNNIIRDGKIIADFDKYYNSNGSGYTDNISCPKTPGGAYMYGFYVSSNISTYLNYDSNLFYCEGTFSSSVVKIFFNALYSNYNQAYYRGVYLPLISGVTSTHFGDRNYTRMSLTGDDYSLADNYDDNFNSDNYNVTSTGTTATGTYYPDGYIDDDNEGRKILQGYVSENDQFKKVFWNTKKVIDIIEQNINNNDIFNVKLGDVTNGRLIFDVDKDFGIKLVVFDKTIYNQSRELYPISTYTGNILSGTGYLQNNSGVLGLSPTITGNEFSFDFKNKNYAIFIKNNSSGALLYKITGKSSSGTGIYISPIDDSIDNIIKYQGSEIIIDEKGMYLSKEAQLIYEK